MRSPRRRFAYCCLDWSERHKGSRAAMVTAAGRRGLADTLGLRLDDSPAAAATV